MGIAILHLSTQYSGAVAKKLCNGRPPPSTYGGLHVQGEIGKEATRESNKVNENVIKTEQKWNIRSSERIYEPNCE
jgi:hypothetical protein